MKVLIIDDSQLIGEKMITIFAENQRICYLGQALSLSSGRTMFREQRPDLVILDLALPDGLGFLLVEEFKETNRSCRIFIFSNYSHTAYKQKAHTIGVDMFFDKSTEFEELMHEVEMFSESYSN
jgi:DNA-binding NarL/FixJ family response regulator